MDIGIAIVVATCIACVTHIIDSAASRGFKVRFAAITAKAITDGMQKAKGE